MNSVYMLMIAFLAIFAAVCVYGAKYEPEKETFFDIHDTKIIRGLFCIIVLMVHVPEGYQNKIQDLIGSFAYIGVTFYFMTSAYGLKYGMLHKENYLRRFWIKRLPALLIPMLLCKIITIVLNLIKGVPFTFISLIYINKWLEVLLLFYFVFWIVYAFSAVLHIPFGYWQDVCICIVIAALSLIDWFTPVKITGLWPTESYGFIYGIILADVYPIVKKWTAEKWKGKCLALFLIGLLLGVAYLKFKLVEFWGDYCLKIILGFALVFLIIIATRKVRIGNRILAFLGGISYEVYLLHFSVFAFLEDVFQINNSAVYIWMSLLITLALATVINMVGKYILRYFQKIKI